MVYMPPMPGDQKGHPRIPEPFLPANLEDLADDPKVAPHEWNAQALEELSRQVGVGCDFYFPLIGSAQVMRAQSGTISNLAAQADLLRETLLNVKELLRDSDVGSSARISNALVHINATLGLDQQIGGCHMTWALVAHKDGYWIALHTGDDKPSALKSFVRKWTKQGFFVAAPERQEDYKRLLDGLLPWHKSPQALQRKAAEEANNDLLARL